MIFRDTKPSMGTADDDSTIDAVEYSTLINRVQSKKRFLPIIRGCKLYVPLDDDGFRLFECCRNPPHHVVKFGYRELDMISPEPTSHSLFGESESKSRKRRVCMHLMVRFPLSSLPSHLFYFRCQKMKLW